MTIPTEYRPRLSATAPPPRNGGYNGLATAIIVGAVALFLAVAALAYAIS